MSNMQEPTIDDLELLMTNLILPFYHDKGMKEKLARGWLPGTPPLEYKTIGDTGKKIHMIDETIAPHKSLRCLSFTLAEITCYRPWNLSCKNWDLPRAMDALCLRATLPRC